MRLPPEYSTEIASMLGALISLRFIENLTFTNAITSLAAGFATAYYFVPLFAEWQKCTEKEMAALGFVFGLIGFCVSAVIYQTVYYMKEWVPVLIKRVIEKKTGGGND